MNTESDQYSMADYLERRIREPIPANSCVIPGSTPVVAFGNARRARVATLGLNPSKLEFRDSQGRELRGSKRRLATHHSLGTPDLSNAPYEVIGQVLKDCDTYFRRNPYRRWFDQLEPILRACGVSYYNDTACHLDIVQWATDPTWGSLPKTAKAELASSDAKFLINQLTREKIEWVLVNGSGVMGQLDEFMETKPAEFEVIVQGKKTRMFAGGTIGKTTIVGWSVNIQSSFGVSRALRNEIARRVGDIVGQNRS